MESPTTLRTYSIVLPSLQPQILRFNESARLGSLTEGVIRKEGSEDNDQGTYDRGAQRGSRETGVETKPSPDTKEFVSLTPCPVSLSRQLVTKEEGSERSGNRERVFGP